MAIEINADDIKRAETFLEAILTEQIPEGRFTEGSALRDLTVKALAFAYAQLQKENATLRSLQSLLSIRDIATTDPDMDRAVSQGTDAILSNWFITRKTGGFARGLIYIEVTRRQDFIIPGAYRFVYDRDRAFYPDVADTAQNIIIRATELFPKLSADGVVQGYEFALRVTAARTGATFNVTPGVWQGGATFSPYAVRIKSTTKFEGGKNRETSTELIQRAGTAISVRNLINTRSVEATLRERFAMLGHMLVVGMGEPEMQRDRKLELATNTRIHMGGHYDAYVELPRVQATFEGQLGGTFLRPDGLINVFRDTQVTDWTAQVVTAANRWEKVYPGDVLRVTGGLPETPKDFVIKEVFPRELRVSGNTPFSEATDESDRALSYYIYRPLHGGDSQIYPAVGVSSTGESSRHITPTAGILLPGGAHYEIIDVAVTNPDVGDPAINLATGYVHFPVRSNLPPEAGEYQVISHQPATAQSMLSFEELRVVGYSGKTLRVVYETLSGLDTLHSFSRDRFERVLTGDLLLRGFFPVYVFLTVPYRLKPQATATVDELALRQDLVDFVNGFSPNDILGVSDISYRVRAFDPNIGSVSAFSLFYTLILPDGRVLTFSTEDEVRLAPGHLVSGQENAAWSDPLAQSVSDRTVRYMTTLPRILVERRD